MHSHKNKTCTFKVGNEKLDAYYDDVVISVKILNCFNIKCKIITKAESSFCANFFFIYLGIK